MSFDQYATQEITADAVNEQDAVNQLAHAKKALLQFKRIAKTILKSASKIPDLFDEGRGSALRKYISAFPEVSSFLDTYMGTLAESEGDESLRKKVISLFANVLLNNGVVNAEQEALFFRYANAGFEYKVLFVEQASLRTSLPKEIRKFLPRNLVFEVDEGGMISQVRDRVGNQMRDLLHKHELLVSMIRDYNDLVDEVKKDMLSPYEDLKLSAILTAIMMETGIRPGADKPGSSVGYEGGEKIEIATFGARSLRPAHIQEFREDFVGIQFKGKAGMDNVAEITDRDIISALTPYIEKAKTEVGLGGSADPAAQLPLFVGLNGFKYSYNYLRQYIKTKLGGSNLEPRDFRMLKATKRFYEHFEECQEDFHEEIKALAVGGAANLKEVVAERVSAFFNQAVERASSSLSHAEQANTINYYISPMIVLNFLSQGYIQTNIETAIVRGFDTISFDVDKFIKVSKLYGTKKYPVSKTAGTDLVDLLDQMKGALGEKSAGTDLIDLLDQMGGALGKV